MMVCFGISSCLWLVCGASAAYVQWQHCDAISPDNTALIPQSLSAKIENINGTHNRLIIGVSRWVDDAKCKHLVGTPSAATLDIHMLGRSSSRQFDVVDVTCQSIAWAEGKSDLRINIAEEMGAFYLLPSFRVNIHLEEAIFEQESCIRANITPELGSKTRYSLSYAPLCIFLFVLLVGILRSAYDNSLTADEAEESGPRSVLPNVGDCLQYLQFIFLTGSLSLFYPGFYQPAVSHLGLFSLFSRGLIRPAWQYEGVSDGIYVVNGTYGGTFGLELMTQVVGAPLTWGTWINMIVAIVIIAIAAAVVLEMYRFLNASQSERHSPTWAGLRYTCKNVFRGVLSYFMLPLVALSFYQLDNAEILPVYHTSLAALFITIILLTFAWLLRQLPTRSLGILIFDSSRRYRQMPTSEASTMQENAFILALFLLTFIRGVAVGGLQISAVAQLIILVLCEIILLAFILAFQAYSVFSIGTISTMARLCTLLLMVTFIPGLAQENGKAAVGFVILWMHACMLVFGFFIPIAYRLVKLCITKWSTPRPRAYGLRDLHRRENSRNNLSAYYNTSPIDTRVNKRALGGHSRPPHEANGDASTAPNRYYRPPRLSSSGASILYSSARHIDITPSTTPGLDTSSGSTSPTSPIRRSIGEQLDAPYAIRASESTNSSSSSRSASDSIPLGPRWNDYSFREADLFYSAPPPNPQRVIPKRPPVSPRESTLSSKLWSKFSGSQPSQKSFQVVRPALDHQNAYGMTPRSGGHPPSNQKDHVGEDDPK